MGIRDHPIAPRSPWQNGYVERLIGSIRRECLDHIVILGEDHLCRVLEAYAPYYDHVRPHLALAKDTPLVRPALRVRPGSRGPSWTGFIINIVGSNYPRAGQSSADGVFGKDSPRANMANPSSLLPPFTAARRSRQRPWH